MENDKILKLLETKQKEIVKLLTEVSKANVTNSQLLKNIDNSLDQINSYPSKDAEETLKENERLKTKLEEISKIVNAPFAISGLSPVDVLKIRKLI